MVIIKGETSMWQVSISPHLTILQYILANIFWDRYENSICSVCLCSGYLYPVIISWAVPSLQIFGSPLPQAMLKVTEISWTVHKHSNMGVGGKEVFQVEFWNLSRYFWPGL